MDEQLVDARGLDCPQPVVLTRRAMLHSGAVKIRVLVDNKNAVDNIQRMALSQGWETSVEGSGDQFQVLLTPGAAPTMQPAEESLPSCDRPTRKPNVVVLIASDVIGSGDDQLGRILMRAFLKTLKEVDPCPTRVIFINAGVRLTTTGSPLLDDLRALEQQGMEIISCGTCLDYFKLLDSLQVGKNSNMYEIATHLVAADRVVRP